MKYLSLLILAAILVFAYIQYDISNTDYVAVETVDEPTNIASSENDVIAAGFISDVEGTATAKAQSGDARKLTPSSQVFVGDTIKTDDGHAELTLDDGSKISVKSNTQFRIQEFAYNPNSDDNINIGELIKGQLRIITGKIGKSKRDQYQLKTQVATIGIRGTHYSVRYCESNECVIQYEGKNETLNSGLYLGVLEGGISANSAAGSVDINSGEIYYQQDANSESIQIEPIADVLFEQSEIDTFMTTGVEHDSSRWIIHNGSNQND